jgi:hypothetical protein
MSVRKPQTEAEWAAYERIQKGKKPLQTKEELRAKQAALHRKQRARDANARAKVKKSNVVALRTTNQRESPDSPEKPGAPKTMGPNERGVRDELALLSKAEERPERCRTSNFDSPRNGLA